MRYLLDTNAVSALAKDHPALWSRLRATTPDQTGRSTIVLHELFFGAHRGQRTEKTLVQIDALPFQIVAFDDRDARKAGEIRAVLTAAGTPIGPYDILIAGQALTRNLTLITRNTREFARVQGLAVENWENGNP